MVLGKLPVSGVLTNLDRSRARVYCAYSRCGWGLFGYFFSGLSFLAPSPWEMARYRLKYCVKGLLSPKQQQQPQDSIYLLIRQEFFPSKTIQEI